MVTNDANVFAKIQIYNSERQFNMFLTMTGIIFLPKYTDSSSLKVQLTIVSRRKPEHT